jgi:hypothetical protein
LEAGGTLCALLLLGMVIGGGTARANDIYLAQGATGANNGSSCANAYAYTFFNTAGNWGGAANQIGPGTTVHLCGTLTCPTNGNLLTAQGSGASGNPVTILFDTATGGNMTSPVCSNGFIVLDNRSHFIIDGGTTCGYVNGGVTACSGHIQNTQNGTGLAYQSHAPAVISAGGSTSDVEIRNLQIGPIYLKTGTADDVGGSPGPRCVIFGGSTSNSIFNIHNNVMHDAGWCLNGGANNLTIAYNEIYNIDHALGMGQYTDTPTTFSTISIHDNHVHDEVLWDTDDNSFHHDGFHLFSYCGTLVGGNNTTCPQTIITGINIYNNRFDGDIGGNYNASIFFEGNIQNANIFNNINVIHSSKNTQEGNGFFNGYGTNINSFNNTVIGQGSAIQTAKFSIFAGPGQVIRNNLYTDGGMISTTGPWPNSCPFTAPGGQGTFSCVNLSYTFSTNAYFGPTDFGNGFGYTNCTGATCSGNGFLNFNASGFASFEAATPEVGGVFRELTTSTILNTSTGAELSGSPTIGAGTNLSSLCIQNGGSLPNALCSDITGTPRPVTTSWDIGAYQSGSVVVGPPSSPSGLSVTSQ